MQPTAPIVLLLLPGRCCGHAALRSCRELASHRFAYIAKSLLRCMTLALTVTALVLQSTRFRQASSERRVGAGRAKTASWHFPWERQSGKIMANWWQNNGIFSGKLIFPWIRVYFAHFGD